LSKGLFLPATVTKRAPRKAAGGGVAGSVLDVEWWPIERLVPHIGNPRKLTDRAVVTLAAILKEFGWQQVIVADKKDVIVAGHTRRLAAMLNGWEVAPVHMAKNLTAAQCDAYRIADNRVAEESDWNEELLAAQLLKLEKQAYDLALTGFSEAEQNQYLRELEKLTVGTPDVPRLPNGRFRGAGDVWILGAHSLICGAGDGLDVAAMVEAWEKFSGATARLQS
jgi:ParB-like chromosome segregation protein Spo0J